MKCIRIFKDKKTKMASTDIDSKMHKVYVKSKIKQVQIDKASPKKLIRVFDGSKERLDDSVRTGQSSRESI